MMQDDANPMDYLLDQTPFPVVPDAIPDPADVTDARRQEDELEPERMMSKESKRPPSETGLPRGEHRYKLPVPKDLVFGESLRHG